jgi:hypothetical protein
MFTPASIDLTDRLAIGAVLDHLWSETMGMPPVDKQAILSQLVSVLKKSRTPYAVIGGVAVQLYSSDPRTTADIDVALLSRYDVPRELLLDAGFEFEKIYPWSENWRSPGPGTKKQRVAVQFSSDELMKRAVDRAETVHAGPLTFQLVTLPDLVALKLTAAEEPTRRLSKRLQDVTDVVRLTEEYPEISDLSLQERIRRLRQMD